MQAKNGNIVATIIVCAVVLALLGAYGFSNIETPVVPTAAAIAALIPAPTETVDNTAAINQILESVAWDSDDISERVSQDAIDFASDSSNIDSEDFEEMFADMIGIDTDFLEIVEISMPETKVTAASEDAADDGDFKVEEFFRVVYKDTDVDEKEVTYVVTTAQIEDLYDTENDQDVEYSIREVERNFEF